MSTGPLRIAVAACFFHADPQRAIFKGKTLLYLEESMGQYLMRHDAWPILLPQPHARFDVHALLEGMDGLLLQGGSDVAPESYGEQPLRPEWAGDRIRDLYEMAFIRAAMERDIPILGICRGAQIINVTLGGTLYQDIETQHPEHKVHRDWHAYDTLHHAVRLVEGGVLDKLYPQKGSKTINSVHHQAVKTLGKNLAADAYSEPDEMIEAVVYQAPQGQRQPFVFGVQWHPEFQTPGDHHLLNPDPIVGHFLDAAKARKDGRLERAV